jgi:hypothetical protein
MSVDDGFMLKAHICHSLRTSAQPWFHMTAHTAQAAYYENMYIEDTYPCKHDFYEGSEDATGVTKKQ